MWFKWTFATSFALVLSVDAVKVPVTQLRQNDGGSSGSSVGIPGVKSVRPTVLAVSGDDGGVDLSCVL